MTGNGTQAIAWQINEETYRQTLETEYSESEAAPPETPGLKIYYGSIHDILSYPCEVSGIAARLSQAIPIALDRTVRQNWFKLRPFRFTDRTDNISRIYIYNLTLLMNISSMCSIKNNTANS